MSTIPADIDAESGPPMAIPLRHFVVGLAFLLLGAAVGVSTALGVYPGQVALAHVHLLLVGWVCVTIMGAMTQFVPVWSGTTLHSLKHARAQLWLVSSGLAGFIICVLGGFYAWLPAVGVVMLLGFWVFVYNVGRTLLAVRPWDVTERHFALALGFLLLVTLFGVALALGFTRPILSDLPIARRGVRESHATLAIFGVVLTTVFGALYQLGTMFTQTALHGIDESLQRIEAVGYPFGVLALAAGRLLENPEIARIGGLLVIFGVAAVGIIVGRRLFETRVEWNPMLRRYGVVAVATVAWSVLTLATWFTDPLGPNATLGNPAGVHLLLVGVVGFVVVGTLYHVVPFIVWVHRYSDRLGFEPVPMIDDLYSDRLARIDFLALGLGGTGLVLGESLSVLSRDGLGMTAGPLGGALASVATVSGGLLATAGLVVFAVNVSLTVYHHSPGSLWWRLEGEESVSNGDSTPAGGAVTADDSASSGLSNPHRQDDRN